YVFEFPDIAQVAVLKGPQGTLFGRNSTGGAIVIHTLDPSLDETIMKVSASWVTFDTGGDDFQFKGYINTPITDKLAFALAAMYQDQDGYLKNDAATGSVYQSNRYGRLESVALRAKILFEPTDNLRILISGMYIDREDQM